MTLKLTPAFALPLVIALGTSTAVFAQDATTGTDTSAGATGTPLDWDDTMNDAFFSDTTAGTLRGDDEITTNWASLTPEQQDRVRQHCETVNADATGTDGAEAPDTLETGDTGTSDPATAAPVAGADGALSTDGTAMDGTATDGAAATGDTATTGDTTTATGDTTTAGDATTGDATATGDMSATGTLSVDQASANMSQLCTLVTDL
ncbi:hypothetical protein [Pseudotabrizicola sp. 4114]|uniref:hypothetical protein n=1 Tax=Pseudotabrizicola sp. 4114 TaxID=2817731 RepID=UPI0028679BAB|nr:putative Fe-S protein YdhL (DUF1289 family) [Pseudorhodobacter sp. 4114]